jgi:hypothetical protein
VKDDEVMWQIAGGAWLYVAGNPSRAGNALVTLAVPDLDEALAEIEDRGLTSAPVETIPGGPQGICHRPRRQHDHVHRGGAPRLLSFHLAWSTLSRLPPGPSQLSGFPAGGRRSGRRDDLALMGGVAVLEVACGWSRLW